MKYWYWPYELRPKRRLSAVADAAPRQGALLRAGGGFADVHPWPELGDQPLHVQLERLAHGELTPLTRRSLALAALDGAAREGHVRLFEGLTVPPSHWLLTEPGNASVPPSFDTVKIKMRRGDALDPALARFRLRLDFNATLEPEEFIAFAASLTPQLREAIEFVEDPCAYDGALWLELKAATALPLALDRGAAGEGVDALVVKPAVQDFPHTTSAAIVVTSYMDHPVGQLGAALVAAQNAARVSTCGLLTHLLYEPDPFTELLRVDGNRLVPPAGTGVGFDDLLESLPWKKLE